MIKTSKWIPVRHFDSTFWGEVKSAIEKCKNPSILVVVNSREEPLFGNTICFEMMYVDVISQRRIFPFEEIRYINIIDGRYR